MFSWSLFSPLITRDDSESIWSRASYSGKVACHVDRPNRRCPFESSVSLSHSPLLAWGSLDITDLPWSRRLSPAVLSILLGWTRSSAFCGERHWKYSSCYWSEKITQFKLLTILRCETLAGLSQPLQTVSSSDIDGWCAAVTSPNYSRRSHKSILRMIWSRATLID